MCGRRGVFNNLSIIIKKKRKKQNEKYLTDYSVHARSSIYFIIWREERGIKHIFRGTPSILLRLVHMVGGALRSNVGRTVGLRVEPVNELILNMVLLKLNLYFVRFIRLRRVN